MAKSFHDIGQSAGSSPGGLATATQGVLPAHYALNTLYLMAVCPRYRILVPVLEQQPELRDETLGWWRCQACLEWHLYLAPS